MLEAQQALKHKRKFNKRTSMVEVATGLLVMCSLVTPAAAAEAEGTAGDDVLGSAGNFRKGLWRAEWQDFQKFNNVTQAISQKASDSYTFEQWDVDKDKKPKEVYTTKAADGLISTETLNGIKVTKKKDAKAFFDDGLWYWLGLESKPQHVKFYLNTDTQEKETCDIRLTTIESLEKLGKAPTTYKATKAPTGKEKLSSDNGKIWTKIQAKQEKDKMPWAYERKKWHDVFFFRLGYLNYMKLNTVNMVQKSKGKTWYKIDILINWQDQRVGVYVNDIFKASSPFFNNEKDRVESANVLAIYGLSAEGVGKFANIEACNAICASSDATKLDMKKTNQLVADGAMAQFAFNAVKMGAAMALLIAA